ncbi:hypothetical protein BDR07DRAFT_438987 [Suillus spraguei]|nr:hypothetical protein BDR07DRAFT_438987 [Suillus spraguei]
MTICPRLRFEHSRSSFGVNLSTFSLLWTLSQRRKKQRKFPVEATRKRNWGRLLSSSLKLKHRIDNNEVDSLFPMLFPILVTCTILGTPTLTAERDFKTDLIISHSVWYHIYLGSHCSNDRCSFLLSVMRIQELARYTSMLKRTGIPTDTVGTRRDSTHTSLHYCLVVQHNFIGSTKEKDIRQQTKMTEYDADISNY